MRALAPLSFVLCCFACTRPASDAGAGEPKGASCSPESLGLVGAKPLVVWKHSCKPAGLSTTVIARTEEELATFLDCGGPSGVDFATHALLVSPRTLSPAGVGHDVYDDGKTVVFVDKQRSTCEGDPLPMPITQVLAFTLPAGASRTFADKACTVERTCP